MAEEKMKTLKDLFMHEVRDLFSAEEQMIEALPKMIDAVHDEELRSALKMHLEETKNQRDRLNKVAKMMDIDPTGETCDAMKGLVQEGQEMLKMNAEKDVKDAAIIASAQRIEHYEMSGYGTARTFAERLGMDEVADLLQETLNEEKNADSILNRIATSSVNRKAESMNN